MNKIKKLQDCDGHWYWIPLDLVEKFEAYIKNLAGLDYMDDPDLFELFDDNFAEFRTLGDPDNMPEYFKNK